MTIDPNDAPAGYKAVPEERRRTCYGCAFSDGYEGSGPDKQHCSRCTMQRRADAYDVIFVPEEDFDEH